MKEEFKNKILELRKTYKLHSFIEDRLKFLFKKVSGDFYVVKEGLGITTGRPDSIIFDWNGVNIHIEIIASKNMVQRDLLNLFNSDAQLKLIILIDEEIDKDVAKQFYKKYKNQFSRLWLSEVVLEDNEEKIIGKIKKVIEEDKQQPFKLFPDKLEFSESEWEQKRTFSIDNNSPKPLFEVYILLNLITGSAKYLRVGPVTIDKDFNEKFGDAEMNYQFIIINGQRSTGKEFILLKIFQVNPNSRLSFSVRTNTQSMIELHILEYREKQPKVLKKSNEIAIEFKLPESLNQFE